MLALKEFQIHVESGEYKILYSCDTRWLSKAACIRRILDQWKALENYFNEFGPQFRTNQSDFISSMLKNPIAKTYYHFMDSKLEPIVNFNLIFQSENTKIHVHYSMARGQI